MEDGDDAPLSAWKPAKNVAGNASFKLSSPEIWWWWRTRFGSWWTSRRRRLCSHVGFAPSRCTVSLRKNYRTPNRFVASSKSLKNCMKMSYRILTKQVSFTDTVQQYVVCFLFRSARSSSSFPFLPSEWSRPHPAELLTGISSPAPIKQGWTQLKYTAEDGTSCRCCVMLPTTGCGTFSSSLYAEGGKVSKIFAPFLCKNRWNSTQQERTRSETSAQSGVKLKIRHRFLGSTHIWSRFGLIKSNKLTI